MPANLENSAVATGLERSVFIPIPKKGNAKEYIAEPVPLQIRNAPTKLMKDLDYGKGYIYAHDTEDKIADMECLPENLRGREYYHPGSQGFEPRFKERYEAIKKWREEHKKK